MFWLLAIGLNGDVSAQEAPPIVNGSKTSDYEPVGLLAICDNNYWYGWFCSGTLVHNRWAITAAHCIEAGEDYERQGYNICFAIGDDATKNNGRGIDAFSTVRNMYMHPSYNGANSGAHDVGVLELAKSLSNIEKMPVNNDTVRSSWEGDPITFVGWGITSDNREDSGVKRTVDVALNNYDASVLYTYERGKNICSGDSGGAALRPDNGHMELVGVVSFGYDVTGGRPLCDTPNAAGGSMRTDRYYSWFENYIPYMEDVDDLDDDTDDDTDTQDTDDDTDTQDTDDDTDTQDTDDDTDDGPMNPDTGLPQGFPERPVREVSAGGCASATVVPGLGGFVILLMGLFRRRS